MVAWGNSDKGTDIILVISFSYFMLPDILLFFWIDFSWWFGNQVLKIDKSICTQEIYGQYSPASVHSVPYWSEKTPHYFLWSKLIAPVHAMKLRYFRFLKLFIVQGNLEQTLFYRFCNGIFCLLSLDFKILLCLSVFSTHISVLTFCFD